jgi:hypothetical protein
MKPTKLFGAGAAILLVILPVAAEAQQGPGAPGQYSGPNVLSRWSRQENGGRVAPTSLRGYLLGSYSFLDGLTGPVNDINAPSAGEASNNLLGGGGLTLTHVDARSSLSLSYAANYTHAYSASTKIYHGTNQDLNLNYERQLTRRLGFYTGHSAGNQSTILGLARPVTQRNFFDQTYSNTTEALDARLKFLNSGAGVFFQKSARLVVSADAGTFLVSRTSRALASSRGERAQGEIAYRTSRKQSIGAVYSFSHFYYPRGFGESHVHTIMLSYTRQLGRFWSLAASAGPYQAENERLQQVAVDPYIAALTGQARTLQAVQSRQRGLSVNTNLTGRYRRHSSLVGYRRAIDPGNGITLTAVSDFGQATYTYQTTKNVTLGGSAFIARMNPLLQGTDRNAEFRSDGFYISGSYRLTSMIHLTGTTGIHRVSYQEFGFRKNRKTVSIGLAFSPASLPLHR